MVRSIYSAKPFPNCGPNSDRRSPLSLKLPPCIGLYLAYFMTVAFALVSYVIYSVGESTIADSFGIFLLPVGAYAVYGIFRKIR